MLFGLLTLLILQLIKYSTYKKLILNAFSTNSCFFCTIKMEKKKETIWNHWTIITQNSAENNKPSSHSSIQYNYCFKIFDRAVPFRMQAHLDKEYLRALNNSKLPYTESSPNTININIPISEINRPIKRTKLSTINNFIDHMNEEEQETLEFLLAQVLFSARVPFAFVENPLVIQFFNYFRLSFKLLNRKKIANELLDEVYEEVKIQADEQISKATTLCMISDSWSNINRELVQNFVICTPKPFFSDATFSGEESHTAEWVANQITQKMNIISI